MRAPNNLAPFGHDHISDALRAAGANTLLVACYIIRNSSVNT